MKLKYLIILVSFARILIYTKCVTEYLHHIDLKSEFKPIIVNFIKKIKERDPDSDEESDDEEKLIKSNKHFYEEDNF